MWGQTADYYNCIMRLDTYIGRLLKVLSATGKAKDTVVVYIGDHGADVMRGKRTSCEGGVRIPMIIRWPGARASGAGWNRKPAWKPGQRSGSTHGTLPCICMGASAASAAGSGHQCGWLRHGAMPRAAGEAR